MEQILFAVIVLCFHCLGVSIAMFQGMTCLKCNDVLSPRHCQDTTICGQGEICFVREFIDSKGLRGFHLGCEDNRTCEVVHQAQSLFGKRDIANGNPSPQNRCYECCSMDRCNERLCQQTTGGHLTTTSAPPTAVSKVVTCMNCDAAEFPYDCEQITTCGSDDICFTREYRDGKGRRRYQMGCESQARCTLFLSAQSLFGRRRTPDPAPPALCYQCCSREGCNAALCHSQLPASVTTLSTTSSTIPTAVASSKTGCPENFVAFKEYCYLFHFGCANRDTSNEFCQVIGSYLLSINSQAEMNFLVKELTERKDATSDVIWIGGIHSADGKWKWVDGSPFNYSVWVPGEPDQGDTYILLGNPAFSNPNYKYGAMLSYIYGDVCRGFVCKTKMSYK